MDKNCCNICYESNVSIIILGNCNHRICINCIRKVNKCPFCRGRIPNDILNLSNIKKKNNINDLDNIELIVDDDTNYINSWINMLDKS